MGVITPKEISAGTLEGLVNYVSQLYQCSTTSNLASAFNRLENLLFH
jgi:hypothetical protein